MNEWMNEWMNELGFIIASFKCLRVYWFRWNIYTTILAICTQTNTYFQKCMKQKHKISPIFVFFNHMPWKYKEKQLKFNKPTREISKKNEKVIEKYQRHDEKSSKIYFTLELQYLRYLYRW